MNNTDNYESALDLDNQASIDTRNLAQHSNTNHLRPSLPSHQLRLPRGDTRPGRSHVGPPRPSHDEFDPGYHQRRNSKREANNRSRKQYFTISPRVDFRQGSKQILIGSENLELNPWQLNVEGDIGVDFEYFREQLLRLQGEVTKIPAPHVPGRTTRYQGEIFLRPDHGSGLGNAECDEEIDSTVSLNKALAFMQERRWIDAIVVSFDRAYER